MLDHSSDFVFHSMQTSADGYQTGDAKHKFKTFSKNCDMQIKHIHVDNKIVNNQLFKESCIATQQTQIFFVVRVYHQNGVDERKIKTVISIARSILLHAMMRWTHTLHLSFWPCTVHCVVGMLNNTPKSNVFTPK